MDTRGPLVSSSLYTVGGDLLVINDVTAIVGVKMFRCSVEMFNRITVRGVGYSVSSPGTYVQYILYIHRLCGRCDSTVL